jgi:hypothetical protein
MLYGGLPPLITTFACPPGVSVTDDSVATSRCGGGVLPMSLQLSMVNPTIEMIAATTMAFENFMLRSPCPIDKSE